MASPLKTTIRRRLIALAVPLPAAPLLFAQQGFGFGPPRDKVVREVESIPTTVIAVHPRVRPEPAKRGEGAAGHARLPRGDAAVEAGHLQRLQAGSVADRAASKVHAGSRPWYR